MKKLLLFMRRHTEAFVSLAALITAVAAVVITMEQTKVMREEAELERRNARISVMPSVWVGTHIGDAEGDAYFKVVLSNKGLGPAVLENFAVTYKGEALQNWDALARRMALDFESPKSFENDTLGSSRSPVTPGLMLEAGGGGVEAVVSRCSAPGCQPVLLLAVRGLLRDPAVPATGRS